MAGVSLSDFVYQMSLVVSTPQTVISKSLSQRLCEMADQGTPAVQYLYAHMVDPEQKVFHDQDEGEGLFSAGEGFVFREEHRLDCFNFSTKTKNLPCDLSNAQKEKKVLPRPLQWEADAKEICLEKMSRWSWRQKTLSPEEAILTLRNNLKVVSLFEFLLPKALPLKGKLENNIQRLHTILKAVLESKEIPADLKRRYGSYLRRRFDFCMGTREEIDVTQRTFYQSAANQMFNTFDRFTETFGTTFEREMYGVLSWKMLGSVAVGAGSYYRWRGFYKGRAISGKQGQSWRPRISDAKTFKMGYQLRATFSAILTFCMAYLLSALGTTLVKREIRKNEELAPCFPPSCPRIDIR